MHALLPIPTNWSILWTTGIMQVLMLQLFLCSQLPQERKKKPKIIVWVNDRTNSCLQCVIINPYHWYYQTDAWVYFCIDRSTLAFIIITVGIIYKSQTWIPTWLVGALISCLAPTSLFLWARFLHPPLASKHIYLTDLIWRHVVLLPEA